MGTVTAPFKNHFVITLVKRRMKTETLGSTENVLVLSMKDILLSGIRKIKATAVHQLKIAPAIAE